LRRRPRARRRLLSGFITAPTSELQTPADQRRKVANFCKLLIELASGEVAKLSDGKPPAQFNENARIAALAPRVRQTLHRMLAGDAEKEIAVHLGVSKHTVHVYVKSLYRHFDVTSRGELLARFVEDGYRNRA